MPKKWTGELVGMMHDYKITGGQLADELGVSREYVSMELNGRRAPDGAKERFTAALKSIIKRTQPG